MVLDLAEIPPTLLQPVTADMRRITTRAGLDDVVRIKNAVWGRDFDGLQERLGDHLGIPGYLSVYVAYVDDVPACAAWICFQPGSQFGGLWGGSTVAAYRGRGLYTAVLAVHRAGGPAPGLPLPHHRRQPYEPPHRRPAWVPTADLHLSVRVGTPPMNYDLVAEAFARRARRQSPRRG